MRISIILVMILMYLGIVSCEGSPGSQGRKGPKGDKGDTGTQGPKGDDATLDDLPTATNDINERGLLSQTTCQTNWTTLDKSGDYQIDYKVSELASGSFECEANINFYKGGRLVETYSNIKTWTKDNINVETAPIGVDPFFLRLKDKSNAEIIYKPTNFRKTFACRANEFAGDGKN